MLLVSESRSWECDLLMQLNIGYICYIQCPVLTLYIHHHAHQGSKVIISKAQKKLLLKLKTSVPAQSGISR